MGSGSCPTEGASPARAAEAASSSLVNLPEQPKSSQRAPADRVLFGEDKAHKWFCCCYWAVFLVFFPLKPFPAVPTGPLPLPTLLLQLLTMRWRGFLCHPDSPFHLGTQPELLSSPPMAAKVLPGPGFPPFIVCKSFSALIYSSSSVPSVPFPRVGHILPSPTQDLPLVLWDMVPGVQSRIPEPTSLISLCPEILIPSSITRQDLLGYPLLWCYSTWGGTDDVWNRGCPGGTWF